MQSGANGPGRSLSPSLSLFSFLSVESELLPSCLLLLRWGGCHRSLQWLQVVLSDIVSDMIPPTHPPTIPFTSLPLRLCVCACACVRESVIAGFIYRPAERRKPSTATFGKVIVIPLHPHGQFYVNFIKFCTCSQGRKNTSATKLKTFQVCLISGALILEIHPIKDIRLPVCGLPLYLSHLSPRPLLFPPGALHRAVP